jgi:ankyrin repeat protein
VAAGAAVDHADGDGWTALYVAAGNGHVAAVQALAAAGEWGAPARRTD